MATNPAVIDPHDTGTAAAVAKRGRVIIDSLDLGNRVIVYYSDGTSETIDKGRLPTDGSSGVSLQTAAISADTAAKQLDEQRRQYNESFGYNKARGDQQQQLSEGEATGYFRGAPTLARDQLNLQKQNSNFDYYKWLADTYANPRNIWESLFVRRGQQLPAALSGMGTGDALGGFFGGGQGFAGQQPAQAPAQRAAPAQAASPYDPNTDPNRGTRFEGLSGFNTDGTYRLAPNDPDAETQMAKYPGKYRIGFAQGGVTPEPMTAIGDWSGQTYRIGEHGAEGIVPAEYLPEFLRSRRGQVIRGSRAYANGGILGFDEGDYGTGDPFQPDPYVDPYAPIPTPNTLTSGFDNLAGTFAQDGNPMGPYAPTITPSDTQDFQQTPFINPAPGAQQPLQTGAPLAPAYTQQPAPTGFHWEGGRLVQDAGTSTVTGGAGRTTGGATGGGATGNGTTNALVGYVPQATPQGVDTFTSAAPGSLMPRDTATPGTFGSLSGNRPAFLPGEDQGGAVSALMAAGILPPFLSRLLGQSRGVQSQGTNQPQRFDLPSDLPLTSSLAASQMTPTERAALESIISSYGIDPADYWAYVQQLSPQGGAAQSPLFGNQFFYGRQ